MGDGDQVVARPIAGGPAGAGAPGAAAGLPLAADSQQPAAGGGSAGDRWRASRSVCSKDRQAKA